MLPNECLFLIFFLTLLMTINPFHDCDLRSHKKTTLGIKTFCHYGQKYGNVRLPPLLGLCVVWSRLKLSNQIFQYFGRKVLNDLFPYCNILLFFSSFRMFTSYLLFLPIFFSIFNEYVIVQFLVKNKKIVVSQC